MKLNPDKELELWRKWKQSQSPQDLDALFAEFDSYIKADMSRKYSGRVQFMTDVTLKYMYHRAMLDAVTAYDPSKGPLAPYIKLWLRNVRDRIADVQNVGYVPPSRTARLTRFRSGVEDLTEQLGREPNAQEISEHLGWSLSEVATTQAESRKILGLVGGGASGGWESGASVMGAKKQELSFLWYELDATGKLILEYLYGLHGKEKLGTMDIAKKLGLSPSMVSRTKKKIETQLKSRT